MPADDAPLPSSKYSFVGSILADSSSSENKERDTTHPDSGGYPPPPPDGPPRPCTNISMRTTHLTHQAHAHTHTHTIWMKKKNRYHLACKKFISAADVVEWSQNIQYANSPIFQEAQRTTMRQACHQNCSRGNQSPRQNIMPNITTGLTFQNLSRQMKNIVCPDVRVPGSLSYVLGSVIAVATCSLKPWKQVSLNRALK